MLHKGGLLLWLRVRWLPWGAARVSPRFDGKPMGGERQCPRLDNGRTAAAPGERMRGHGVGGGGFFVGGRVFRAAIPSLFVVIRAVGEGVDDAS
jgi:hypothetical protein